MLPRPSWPAPGKLKPTPGIRPGRPGEDAAREREALDGQYQAWLEAAGQLAAAERDRALRAEQRLDAERERYDSLLAALTAAGGAGTQPAALAVGGPGGPASWCPRHGRNTS